MNFLRTGVSIALAILVAGSAAVGCGGSVHDSGKAGAGGGAGAGGAAGAGGNPGDGGQGATGGSSGSGGMATGGTSGAGGIGGTGGTGVGGQGGQGGQTVIAVKQFFFGDTDPNGQLDPNAWKSIGLNLDGLDSTASSTNHCTPQPGADPTTVKTDGNNGIDNSFGENLIPLFTSLASDFSGSINQSIAAGSFTELFRLDGLKDPSQVTDQSGILGALLGGADKGSPALFNGTDVWPVTYASVNNGNINSPKVAFPTSYVSSSMWISGSKTDFVLPASLQGYEMDLPISDATVRMLISGVHTSASADNGVIAGVMDTQAFLAQLQKVMGAFDPTLCSGPTWQSIAQQIMAASDIMSDGTNGDPTKTCNAISIGIGFTGAGVTLGAVATQVPPPPNPCAP